MADNCLYKLLKVTRNCTSEDIVNAWNSLQKTVKPPTVQYETAQKAFETLIDPVKRELYDNFSILNSTSDPVDTYFSFSPGFLDNREIELVVGKLRSKSRTKIIVSLTDLYIGKTVEVITKAPRSCNQCQNYVNIVPCPECSMLLSPKIPTCHTCKNSRKIALPNVCKVCNGSKVVFVDSTTEANIPPGCLEGKKVKCSNNVTEVTVKQAPHPLFSRQGNDLYMKKSVNLAQALCGIRFVIQHLDGRNLLVTSPGGQVLFPGCRKIIPKEGMPFPNSNDGKKGDLIIVFQVNMPNSIKIDAVKEIETLLPKRPDFHMPSNPETEEYNLVDFDPKFKLVTGARHDEAYFDDKPMADNPLLKSKEQCVHQ